MSFELYPDETVQGMIAFDGSNICTNIFPQIDVTVSYLRPDIQRKREIKRTVTFNNGYEQKISADINIDNHKTEENLGSVARACVRIANYLDGHNLASFDNLDITPNRSLHDDIVTAINTKKEIHVLERSETLEECFGKKAKNIHMKNKSKK